MLGDSSLVAGTKPVLLFGSDLGFSIHLLGVFPAPEGSDLYGASNDNQAFIQVSAVCTPSAMAVAADDASRAVTTLI